MQIEGDSKLPLLIAGRVRYCLNMCILMRWSCVHARDLTATIAVQWEVTAATGNSQVGPRRVPESVSPAGLAYHRPTCARKWKPSPFSTPFPLKCSAAPGSPFDWLTLADFFPRCNAGEAWKPQQLSDRLLFSCSRPLHHRRPRRCVGAPLVILLVPDSLCGSAWPRLPPSASAVSSSPSFLLRQLGISLPSFDYLGTRCRPR
jgi:hypothetical protein